MSATNQTTNFNLPLYQENDTTSWLVDFNGAMRTIDENMANISIRANNASEKSEENKTEIEHMKENVENVNNEVSSLSSDIALYGADIALLKTHSNEQDVRLDNLENKDEELTENYNALNTRMTENYNALNTRITENTTAIEKNSTNLTNFKNNSILTTHILTDSDIKQNYLNFENFLKQVDYSGCYVSERFSKNSDGGVVTTNRQHMMLEGSGVVLEGVNKNNLIISFDMRSIFNGIPNINVNLFNKTTNDFINAVSYGKINDITMELHIKILDEISVGTEIGFNIDVNYLYTR